MNKQLSNFIKIIKIYKENEYFSNGDFEPLGRIELKKSNKIFIANTKMKRENY